MSPCLLGGRHGGWLGRGATGGRRRRNNVAAQGVGVRRGPSRTVSWKNIPKTRVERWSGRGPVVVRTGSPGARSRRSWTTEAPDRGGGSGSGRSLGATRGRHCLDVGVGNVCEAPKPLGKVAALGGGPTAPYVCRDSGFVRGCYGRGVPRPVAVRKGFVGDFSPPRIIEPAVVELGRRAASCGRNDSAGAGAADGQTGTADLGRLARGSHPVGGARVLEDRVSVGRGARSHFGSLLVGRGRGGDRRLGNTSEAQTGGSLRAFEMVGYSRRSGGRNRGIGALSSSIRAPHGRQHREDRVGLAKNSGYGGFYGPLRKAGRGGGSGEGVGRGKAGRGAFGVSSVETQGGRCSVGGGDSQVFVKPGGHGSCAADLEGDTAALNRRIRSVPGATRHSIVRKGKRTRLPVTETEMHSPLHVSGVCTMDVGGLRRRLSEEARGRFDEVWDMTFAPTVTTDAGRRAPSSFALRHARELCQHGVARAAEGPGRTTNVPFTVLEEKPEGLRQRFILWTRDANDRLEGVYEPKVPLGHISQYLEQVREQCGSTRDFRTGFYAIEIPEDARDLFRFQTSEGSWFELCRLPMGHACAPEIMHTLAAAAAGDPVYVSGRWAAKGVKVDVFVDNIRYVGTEEAVLAATVNLDGAASEFRLTWKEADSHTAVRRYTFLGVDFDHDADTVVVASKIREKVGRVDFVGITAGDLESLGGRLLHASAVAGVSPGSFWFALKFLRRVSNGLNRGVRVVEDRVVVPPSVVRELRGWIGAVLQLRLVGESFRPECQAFSIFVDASLKGWGGVVVNDDTAEVTVMGDSWVVGEAGLHISVLEGLALRNTVRDMPTTCDGCCVKIWVDNTSVLGAARKRMSIRSELLNRATVSALDCLRARNVTFSLEYVKSAENPADIPSRVDPVVISTSRHQREVELAVRRFFTGDAVVVDCANYRGASSEARVPHYSLPHRG